MEAGGESPAQCPGGVADLLSSWSWGRVEEVGSTKVWKLTIKWGMCSCGVELRRMGHMGVKVEAVFLLKRRPLEAALEALVPQP